MTTKSSIVKTVCIATLGAGIAVSSAQSFPVSFGNKDGVIKSVDLQEGDYDSFLLANLGPGYKRPPGMNWKERDRNEQMMLEMQMLIDEMEEKKRLEEKKDSESTGTGSLNQLIS